MPLIDTTYFDGSLIISGITTEPISDAVETAILTYEPEFLRKLMGPSLYAAYESGISAITTGFSSGFSSGFGNGSNSLEQRWAWVRDGYTYTYNGKPYTWGGLDKAIAAYTYWNYRAENITLTTSTGEEKVKGSNVDVVSPDRKMIAAWNRMVDWCREFAHMVQYLRTGDAKVYPEFDWYEPDSDVYAYQNTLGI